MKAVIEDILDHGNAPPEGRAMLPGQIEHDAVVRTEQAGGWLFTDAEIDVFVHIAKEAGRSLHKSALATFE